MLNPTGEARKWVHHLCHGEGKQVSAISCHNSTKNFPVLIVETDMALEESKEWHQQHAWRRHASWYPPSTPTIQHLSGTEVPLWEVWDPPPHAKGARGVLPTHVHHTGLSCGPLSGCERSTVPLAMAQEPLRNTVLRQSPMDERAFLEVPVPSREAPAHHWRKKIQCGHTAEVKRNS